MNVILLTTLPNQVSTTLSSILGNNLLIMDIPKLEDKKTSIMKIIHEHAADILITYRCPYILPIEVIAALPLGAYNIHPSLLPKYKGLNPWEEIFRNHESKSGVTLHRITKDVDCGPIVAQKSFVIASADTMVTARNKADLLAAELVSDFITNLQANPSLLPLPNKFDYLEAICSRENLLFLKHNDSWEYSGIYLEGAFCIVFQGLINGEKYAVRCWKCLNAKDKEVICRKVKLISEWIEKAQPKYLKEIFLIEKGISTIKGIYPVSIMKWCDDMNLKEYISQHIKEPLLLLKLPTLFVEMVSYFHQLHIAHGDMNMENIRINPDGMLYMIDYDTLYVPTMEQEIDDVKGKPGYQHHARNNNMYLSEYIDYYSEYIIFLIMKALAKYPNIWNLFDFTNNGVCLHKSDYSNIQNSLIYSFIREKCDEELMSILMSINDMWHNVNCLNSIIPIEESGFLLDTQS
ncbi:MULTISPECIES: formyltransferase family protein [Bacteroides]|uniref:formyltransferase family protein n=2 Tax=Bacteroidales TaxID=171549 RepID=UPI0026DF841C|nr:formyltransferase family protein [Bacteroides sp.]MDO5419819.1 formyltransferase family protein [Bacteroides sp.]